LRTVWGAEPKQDQAAILQDQGDAVRDDQLAEMTLVQGSGGAEA
jgi:hypothetical protein